MINLDHKIKRKEKPQRLIYEVHGKVSYMKELRELGLDFEEIKKIVDKEFPSITNPLHSSESDLSSSSVDKEI
ncbi:hypothetical protein VP01_1038g8 [Puccinia sorghi]|uniref:Uncharacterized protein n=1 Tax=Puccinia sorghi TaxID=27349 RepID=A0A0L6VUP0_9BASI|nr:hypothetical protein VP01_1038g8 [Puccinia sorghi]